MTNLVKADLHNHIAPIGRKKYDFNKVVDRATDALGYGCVLCVTNFENSRYEDLVNSPGYYRTNIGNAVHVREKSCLIVKAQEVPTQQGEILAVGLKQGASLKPDRTLGDVIKEAKDQNTVIIAPHPFFNGGLGKSITPYLGEFDAIEVHNGEASLWLPGVTKRNANKKALEFYAMVKNDFPNLGAIASSDGHSLFEMGSNYIWIDCPNTADSDALVNSLRKSVRSHKSIAEDIQSKSLFGALIHGFDIKYHQLIKRDI